MPQHRSTSQKKLSKKRQERLPSQNGRPTSSLVFTGRRRDDRFRVYFNGKPTELTPRSLMVLIDLVLAHGKPGSAFISMPKMTIYRLRWELGRGAGKKLVETGSGAEYRLAIPSNELQGCVALTPCFFELIGVGVVSKDEAELLVRLCRLCDQAEADRLLYRDRRVTQRVLEND